MKALLTVLLVCLGANVASADTKSTQSRQLYRFENEQGVTVLSTSIPPDLVYKGYSIVKEDGTVVKTVPRQLTPGEVAKRDREDAEKKAAEEAGVARQRHDEELVKLYASPRDVEEARNRKISSIDTAIATNKANLEGLKLKKEHLEEQAADREREGLAPSADILDNLKILDTQIGEKEREIEARQVEKQHVSDQFQLDLDRIKLLYSVPPANTAAKAEAVH